LTDDQRPPGSLSVILGAFVAVLFSEIVSAKCENALPGVVLVIDSAAELDVDVAINGQFCPTSPQISVRLIEGLKRRVVQHTYQIMFHDHVVRLIIFVGIHVAKAMTGWSTTLLVAAPQLFARSACAETEAAVLRASPRHF